MHTTITTNDEEGTERLARHLEDLRAHRPFRDFQFKYVTPTGRLLYLRISGKPVFTVEGHFSGYCGMVSNVTIEVLAEQRALRTQC